MEKGAIISDDGLYRYHLWRSWDNKLSSVCFIMLNPSTADAEKDDATIRRCIGFAKSWGHGRIDVVNLYAFRATKPSELWKVNDPVGPYNNIYIGQACAYAYNLYKGIVVAAWGANAMKARAHEIISMLMKQLPQYPVYQIGHYNFPRHPLRLPKDLRPSPITFP